MCRGSGVHIHTSLQVLRQLPVTARRESWIASTTFCLILLTESLSELGVHRVDSKQQNPAPLLLSTNHWGCRYTWLFMCVLEEQNQVLMLVSYQPPLLLLLLIFFYFNLLVLPLNSVGSSGSVFNEVTITVFYWLGGGGACL